WAILPLLWLLSPISLHVVEMAWVDPLLVAGCALTASGLAGRRWASAGLALGFCCAVRQYAVFFALLVFLRVLLREGPRALARLMGACVALWALIMAPSLLGDFKAFYAATVQTLFGYQTRRDALSLPSALLNLWGYSLSDQVMSASYLMSLALAAAWLVR